MHMILWSSPSTMTTQVKPHDIASHCITGFDPGFGAQHVGAPRISPLMWYSVFIPFKIGVNIYIDVRWTHEKPICSKVEWGSRECENFSNLLQ